VFTRFNSRASGAGLTGAAGLEARIVVLLTTIYGGGRGIRPKLSPCSSDVQETVHNVKNASYLYLLCAVKGDLHIAFTSTEAPSGECS